MKTMIQWKVYCMETPGDSIGVMTIEAMEDQEINRTPKGITQEDTKEEGDFKTTPEQEDTKEVKDIIGMIPEWK